MALIRVLTLYMCVYVCTCVCVWLRRRLRQLGKLSEQSPLFWDCAFLFLSTSMDLVSKDVSVDVGFLGGTLGICATHWAWEVSTVCATREGEYVWIGALCNNVSHLYTEPSVEVFQPSNKEGFSLGLQLKKWVMWAVLSNTNIFYSFFWRFHDWMSFLWTVKSSID